MENGLAKDEEQNEVSRDIFTSKDGLWLMAKLFPKHRWAHHPVCECYHGHLITFHRLHICLGCFSLAIGITLSVICLLAIHLTGRSVFSFKFTPVFILGILAFLPTLVQPFYQQKQFKIFSRMLLGTSITALTYAILVALPWSSEGIALKALGLLIFYLTYKATLRFRNAFTPTPTCRCSYPFTASNKQYLLSILNELEERVGVNSELYNYANELIYQTENRFEVHR